MNDVAVDLHEVTRPGPVLLHGVDHRGRKGRRIVGDVGVLGQTHTVEVQKP